MIKLALKRKEGIGLDLSSSLRSVNICYNAKDLNVGGRFRNISDYWEHPLFLYHVTCLSNSQVLQGIGEEINREVKYEQLYKETKGPITKK